MFHLQNFQFQDYDFLSLWEDLGERVLDEGDFGSKGRKGEMKREESRVESREQRFTPVTSSTWKPEIEASLSNLYAPPAPPPSSFPPPPFPPSPGRVGPRIWLSSKGLA